MSDITGCIDIITYDYWHIRAGVTKVWQPFLQSLSISWTRQVVSDWLIHCCVVMQALWCAQTTCGRQLHMPVKKFINDNGAAECIYETFWNNVIGLCYARTLHFKSFSL